ncbi:MAG: hypothetical protein PHI48_05605 [Bacteroidales bacterium]|nr:hypothetical protein [Bacteroidales bacterium]
MKINSKVSLASALLLILALFCGFHSLLSDRQAVNGIIPFTA